MTEWCHTAAGGRIRRDKQTRLVVALGGTFALVCLFTPPCYAQTARPLNEVTSPNGAVGKRQNAPEVDDRRAPTERISSRIENRVQSRLLNRIDRSYDASGNAASYLEIANARAKTTARPRRR